MRARTLVRRLHLLAAATAGLVLVVAGLTGSALVYRDALDRALSPELLHVEGAGATIGLEQTLALATAAYPGEQPARIEMARTGSEPHLVVMKGEDPLQVFVDPYRGRVLGARRQSESLPQLLFEVHTKLLAGHNGELVMGTTGVLLVAAALSGLWLWRPGIGRGLRGLREALTVRRTGNWKRTNFDLHRAVGAASALLLALSGFTGAALVFHDPVVLALDRITGSPPRLTAPQLEPTSAPRLTADDLVTGGRSAIDALAPYYLILPARPDAPAVVRGRIPGELHPNGRNFAYLDPATGELLGAERATEAPVGTRIYDTFYPLHIGRWGGHWTRLLYVALGFTPLLLGVTGALMWRNRTRRTRRGARVARGPERVRRAA